MGKVSQRYEEQAVLFGMSQGAEMDYCRGTVQGHGPRTPNGFASCGRLIAVVVHLCFHSLIPFWVHSPKASNVPAAFRQTVSETLSVAPERNS